MSLFKKGIPYPCLTVICGSRLIFEPHKFELKAWDLSLKAGGMSLEARIRALKLGFES